MKYNLRFYLKCAGRDNDCFEDYNQGYLRTFSNIATYQLDRNAVEEGMIICNLFDAEHVSSHFALLDAHRVAEGPVAKVRAPCPVHLGFHATFTAASP